MFEFAKAREVTQRQPENALIRFQAASTPRKHPKCVPLKNILALSGKELRSLFGDTILVIFIVMMFSTMVYNTATNATSDVRNANIGMWITTAARSRAKLLPRCCRRNLLSPFTFIPTTRKRCWIKAS